MNLFTKKIPFYIVIIAILSGGIISYFIFATGSTPPVPQHDAHLLNTECVYSIIRLNDYKYVKPILSAAQTCESVKFITLKDKVTEAIAKDKKDGLITSASVYVRSLNQDEWMSINEQEKCLSGSLMKVPLLIAYLRMDELTPGVMNKEILFDHPFSSEKHPVFTSESIQLGHKYTIRQLLHYSIAYSDNEAASLLSTHLDSEIFKRVFSDLGLPKVDISASSYPFTAKTFSILVETLYNAAYLTIPNSEYATSLLTECNFKKGIVAGLPEGITVAHKFGEAGDGDIFELHESAIVYLNNTPYILTVMSKGRDIQKLPSVISEISRLVYDDMVKQPML